MCELMSFELTNNQHNEILLKGSTAEASGVELTEQLLPSSIIPSWSIDNTSLATITPASDGRSAVLTPVTGQTGTVTISVSAVVNGNTITGSVQEVITSNNPILLAFVLQPQTPVNN